MSSFRLYEHAAAVAHNEDVLELKEAMQQAMDLLDLSTHKLLDDQLTKLLASPRQVRRERRRIEQNRTEQAREIQRMLRSATRAVLNKRQERTVVNEKKELLKQLQEHMNLLLHGVIEENEKMAAQHNDAYNRGRAAAYRGVMDNLLPGAIAFITVWHIDEANAEPIDKAGKALAAVDAAVKQDK